MSWINTICSHIGVEMGMNYEIPPHCTSLIDDCMAWYEYGWDQLLVYKYRKTNSMFSGMIEVVFTLGDFRLNIYWSEKLGWMDCKYKPINPQKNELQNIANALMNTALVRFKELNARLKKANEHPYKNFAYWMFYQLKTRNLEYEYPSYYGRL